MEHSALQKIQAECFCQNIRLQYFVTERFQYDKACSDGFKF